MDIDPPTLEFYGAQFNATEDRAPALKDEYDNVMKDAEYLG